MIEGRRLIPAGILAGPLALGFFALSNSVALSQTEPAPQHARTVLSTPYTVDKKYKSMMGPQSTEDVYLLDQPSEELLWITGYHAVMVGEDGKSAMSQEFMCHSNLDFESARHREHFSDGNYANSRLFTLSQGQFDVSFPQGFGIPVIGSEPLSLTTQVLNHNIEGQTFNVRHKITIDYVRDADLAKPLKPLYPASAYGLKTLGSEPGYYNLANADPEEHGPGCMVGSNAANHEYVDSFSKKFTGHWIVRPGKEVNRTLVTRLMALPYDTKIHYIAVHLHPFAESLELLDLTTGNSLFKSKARNLQERIGLQHVGYLSSPQGIPVYEEHEYEIISAYNNTSGQDQDSMAVMYLYLADRDFKRPEL